MRRLASWCFTHRRIVLLGWLVALIGLTALHSALGSAYSDNFRLSGTQSFDAVNLLERSAPKASGDTEQVVIAVHHGKVTDPAVRSEVESMLAALARQPHVSEISSPYGPRGAGQISPSGQVAFANATFDVQANKLTAPAAKNFVKAARSASGNGVEIEVEGQVAQAANQQGPGGLPFGIVAAGIVLFIVFGSLLAMALPLVTAGLSLGTAVAAIGLLSHVIQMASFTNELSLLIGLGVGVDYALFIVTRYRQGLLRGLSGQEAVVEALDTSGRAVLFAGDDRVHRDARHVRARRELPLRGRDRNLDRGRVHRARVVDAAPGPAGVLRHARAAPPRAPRAQGGEAPYQRRVGGVGALGRVDAEAPGAVRGRRGRGARAACDSVPLDATRLGRLGL